MYPIVSIKGLIKEKGYCINFHKKIDLLSQWRAGILKFFLSGNESYRYPFEELLKINFTICNFIYQ